MVLHSAVIEKFKGIDYVEVEAHGNHIILTGVNGTCKTTVIEAFLSCLLGKKVLPEDPVMHGEESSKIELNIGDEPGGSVLYTASADIKSNDFKIKVSTYNLQGHKLTVSKPVSFMESIISKEFIDPLNFSNKNGKDRIAMLYQLIPGLQEQLKALDDEYVGIQVERSEIGKEKRRLEHEIADYPFTEDVPEKEVDPAEILEKINQAESHNLKKTGLENSIDSVKSDIKITEESLSNAKSALENLRKEIEKTEHQIKILEEQLNNQHHCFDGYIATLAEFKLIDVAPIKAEMATINETNKAIRDNIKHKELRSKIAEQQYKYSDKLTDMREIEEKKITVFRDADMPVKGLSVGDNDIMFPDPSSGEMVNFGSLSTGQKCRVSVGILAGFLPDPKDGIRCMIIQDVNSLDEKNYEAMLSAAKENNIQLIMHKTAFRSESNELEIVIEER